MVIKTSTFKFREINLLEWVSRARGKEPEFINYPNQQDSGTGPGMTLFLVIISYWLLGVLRDRMTGHRVSAWALRDRVL